MVGLAGFEPATSCLGGGLFGLLGWVWVGWFSLESSRFWFLGSLVDRAVIGEACAVFVG